MLTILLADYLRLLRRFASGRPSTYYRTSHPNECGSIDVKTRIDIHRKRGLAAAMGPKARPHNVKSLLTGSQILIRITNGLYLEFVIELVTELIIDITYSKLPIEVNFFHSIRHQDMEEKALLLKKIIAAHCKSHIPEEIGHTAFALSLHWELRPVHYLLALEHDMWLLIGSKNIT